MTDIDWNLYENFSEEEFACSHTGRCHMDKDHMDKLQSMRHASPFPFVVTSGYRAPTHPIEAAKNNPGEHSMGKATDLRARGVQALWLIENARKFGFNRVGVKQSGGGRFIHLGSATKGFSSPALWNY